MNPQPNSPAPNAGAINELAKAAVHSHRIKLRVLNTAAFVFGFVAVAASIFTVAFYEIKYLPKQREMIELSQKAADLARTDTGSTEELAKGTAKVLAHEVILTYVTSMGVTLVAAAVGALGLGTLVLVTVVMLNRRVALEQINANLAQISGQLRQLQSRQGSQ